MIALHASKLTIFSDYKFLSNTHISNLPVAFLFYKQVCLLQLATFMLHSNKSLKRRELKNSPVVLKKKSLSMYAEKNDFGVLIGTKKRVQLFDLNGLKVSIMHDLHVCR